MVVANVIRLTMHIWTSTSLGAIMYVSSKFKGESWVMSQMTTAQPFCKTLYKMVITASRKAGHYRLAHSVPNYSLYTYRTATFHSRYSLRHKTTATLHFHWSRLAEHSTELKRAGPLLKHLICIGSKPGNTSKPRTTKCIGKTYNVMSAAQPQSL